VSTEISRLLKKALSEVVFLLPHENGPIDSKAIPMTDWSSVMPQIDLPIEPATP
jgi:hypothetical protein